MMERWRSYQWRKMMGASVEQYDGTPGLTVDWDIEMNQTELRVQREKQEAANRS